jgi:hypothetical protein
MPAGGYGFEPIDLPPVIPPGVDAVGEEPPLVEPIPVEAAFEPAPIVPISDPGAVALDFGPATVTPQAPITPPASQRPAPVLDMLGAQPAPVTGPDVDIARGRDRQRVLSEARTAAEQDSATAAEDYRLAATAWQAAKTPEERAAAEAQAEDAQQRMQGARAVAQASGLAQEREDAAQQAIVGEALTSARTAKLAEVAEVLNSRAAETQRKVDEAAAIRVKAAERRAAREQEYATVLERGPQDKKATWTSAVGMIGEMFAAYAQRRPPNFDTWLERGLQMARETHKGELDAIRARIGAEDQAIEDAAVEVASARADDAAFEQAILASTDRDLQVLAARYAGTPQGMAAEQARRAVAEKQALRASEAAAAAEKAQREREKHAAEMRKMGAEAQIAERKAGLGGGGAGGATAGALNVAEPTQVIVPGTDIVLADFGKQKDGAKRAEKARAAVQSTYGFLQKLNQYEALLEDYGARKLLDQSGWTESAEYRNLATQWESLKVSMAKMIAGQGFSTTESDQRTAERLIPIASDAWKRTDSARVAVAKLKEIGEDEMRLTLNANGLKTGAQEELVRRVRLRGTSKRDVARQLYLNAETIVSDIDQPAATRIEAVKLLPEKAKQEASERGDEGDAWIPVAINKLKVALQQADSGEMEAAIRAELDPLERMWRNKGEGATTREDVERARDRDREFPRSIR